MKALFVVTGRGMGGDAVTALNISKALSKYGVTCEFALDHTAPGILFKKKGIKWHKISIPHAGGHAATKPTIIKAGFKTIKAVIEAVQLFRKIRPDVIVGTIGGGAIVGCLAAKISNIPSVGILITPLDSRLTRITTTVALPESPLFRLNVANKRAYKSYSPVNPDIVSGNMEKARKLMPETYDETLPTILLSSGSTLFEKMALAASKLRNSEIKANIVVIGHPLEERYRDYLEVDGILYLGYVDWVRDLYQLTDIMITTDDGMMIQEAIACNLPVITLLKVKYGRYHNMGEIFKGAMVESELDDLDKTVKMFLENIDKIKNNASKYSVEVLQASDKIAKIIYNLIK